MIAGDRHVAIGASIYFARTLFGGIAVKVIVDALLASFLDAFPIGEAVGPYPCAEGVISA
jgi:hypothetical protein